MNKRSLQFELWEECNNNCPFCYLDYGKIKTDDVLKIKSLLLSILRISMPDINEYDVLSYIGGEFFLGQLHNSEVKKLFYKLIEKTAYLYNNNIIKEIWLNATMTIGNLHELFECLDMFNNHDNIWLCSSYDTIGRFNDTKLNIWKTTMEKLHLTYPTLKFNISTIITGDLIQKYLTDEFSFKKFKEKYHCCFFLKSPGTGGYPTTVEYKLQFNKQKLANFFPTRENMLKFLTKYKLTETLFDFDKIYNIELRADDLIKYTLDNKDDKVEFVREKTKQMVDFVIKDNKKIDLELQKCGHRIVYKPYVDSDACFVCDKYLIQGID